MNQPVTITFVPQQVLTWIVIGMIAGLLAGLFVRGRRFGLIVSVIIGLVGALVGGFIFALLHIKLPITGGITVEWADIVIAFIGAVIVLVVAGLIFRRRA